MKNSLLLALVLAATLPADEVRLQVTADPVDPLLGIPPTLRLTMHNAGDAEATLPRHYMMVVSPANARPFIPLWHSSRIANLSEEVPAKIGQGASVEIELPSDTSLGRPAWFSDPRLNRSGVYTFVLIASDDLTDVQVSRILIEGTDLRSLLASVPGGALRSNEVVLTFREPHGDDAAVCEIARRSVGEGRGECPVRDLLFQQDALREVTSTYPTSAYTQYLLLRRTGGSVRENVQRAVRIIEYDPNGRLTDWIRLYVADTEHWLANDHSSRGEVTLYRESESAARQGYRWLVDNARFTRIRAEAKRQLDLLEETVEERAVRSRK